MMKLNNPIRKATAYTLSILLGMAAISSCADDLEVRSNNGEPFGTTLTIYIPNVDEAAEYGRTRADYQSQADLADANEAVINNLSFFAYPVKKEGNVYVEDNSNNRKPIIQTNLTPATGAAVFSYKAYTIDGFQAGDYRMYVLANLDRYVDELSLSPSTPESYIRNLVLKFGDTTDKYLLEGYLPMACLNTEMKYDAAGNKKVDSTDGVFTLAEGQNEVYADMTFLCAKVRYTILFDKTDFSSSFSSDDVNFTDAKANNVMKEYAPMDGTAVNTSPYSGFTLFSKAHEEKVYPGTDSQFLKENGPAASAEYYEKDLDKLTGNHAANKRAWQGTIYLPCNTSTTKTNISFTASGTGIKTEVDAYKFDIASLEKGKFYDFVARVTEAQSIDFTTNLTIHPWTTQNLSYALHGPYELIVETTKVSVSSSEPAIFWYKSDVAPQNIHFASPTITVNGRGVDFYIASVYRDSKGQYILTEDGEYQIEVKINPAVTFSTLQDVENGRNGYKKDDYKYFEVIAGNIQKKILVEPLTLKAFLTVAPQNILINVGEYVSSGLKSDYIDIDVSTNINNTLTISGLSLTYGTSTSGVYEMEFVKGDDTSALSATSMTITDGHGVLRLKLDKFFNESTFWQTERTITFIIKASDGSTSSTNAEGTVTITIKPYTTNYVIHFHPLKKDWTSPHIYIYQCLDLPADLKGTNSTYAGKTVGYGSEDDGTKGNAGLEYLFTNNIAFKGWSGYGGTVDPNKSGTTWANGFVLWGGKDSAYDFNPSNAKTAIYNYEADLNSQHNPKAQSHCQACSYITTTSPGHWNGLNFNSGGANGTAGSHQFAGVAMIPETIDGETWYKYTLSGVATPGKAMIMFNDDHSNGDTGRRYPNTNEVGVPLFDFPDNEGWFVFDGNCSRHDLNFYDDKPDLDKIKPKEYKFKFYFPNTATGVYFWDWNDCTLASGYTGNLNNFDNSKNVAKASEISGYNCVEFTRYSTSGNYGWKFSSPEQGNGNSGSISNFKLEDGVYYAHVTSVAGGLSLVPGKPTAKVRDNNKFYSGDKITVKWYSEYSNIIYKRIYVEDKSNSSYTPLGGWPGTNACDWNAKQNNEVSFELDRDLDALYIQIHQEYNDNNQIGKYYAYPTKIDYSSGTCGKSPKLDQTKDFNTNNKEFIYILW